MKNSYHVLFRPEPEGGFTVMVPSLPGCVTYGKTLSEARRMAEEAIEAYIQSLKKHRESIPTDDLLYSTEIRVTGRNGRREYAA